MEPVYHRQLCAAVDGAWHTNTFEWKQESALRRSTRLEVGGQSPKSTLCTEASTTDGSKPTAEQQGSAESESLSDSFCQFESDDWWEGGFSGSESEKEDTGKHPHESASSTRERSRERCFKRHTPNVGASSDRKPIDKPSASSGHVQKEKQGLKSVGRTSLYDSTVQLGHERGATHHSAHGTCGRPVRRTSSHESSTRSRSTEHGRRKAASEELSYGSESSTVHLGRNAPSRSAEYERPRPAARRASSCESSLIVPHERPSSTHSSEHERRRPVRQVSSCESIGTLERNSSSHSAEYDRRRPTVRLEREVTNHSSEHERRRPASRTPSYGDDESTEPLELHVSSHSTEHDRRRPTARTSSHVSSVLQEREVSNHSTEHERRRPASRTPSYGYESTLPLELHVSSHSTDHERRRPLARRASSCESSVNIERSASRSHSADHERRRQARRASSQSSGRRRPAGRTSSNERRLSSHRQKDASHMQPRSSSYHGDEKRCEVAQQHHQACPESPRHESPPHVGDRLHLAAAGDQTYRESAGEKSHHCGDRHGVLDNRDQSPPELPRFNMSLDSERDRVVARHQSCQESHRRRSSQSEESLHRGVNRHQSCPESPRHPPHKKSHMLITPLILAERGALRYKTSLEARNRSKSPRSTIRHHTARVESLLRPLELKPSHDEVFRQNPRRLSDHSKVEEAAADSVAWETDADAFAANNFANESPPSPPKRRASRRLSNHHFI